MKRALLVLALWFAAVPVVAQVERPSPPGKPVAKIVGPERSEPGDLVVMRVGDGSANSYVWRVYPAQYEGKTFQVENGRAIVFASRQPCVVAFILVATAGDQSDIAIQELFNGIDSGPNPPGPSPTPPGPVPPTPTPTDFSGKIRTLANQLVPQEGRAEAAKALAAAYTAQVSAIAAGTYKTPAEARAGVREAAHTALGYTRTQLWTPWFVATGKEIETRCGKTEGAAALDCLGKTLGEVSIGLKGVQ